MEKDFDDRTLDERLAAGEPRAYAFAYGHPGALERVCKERDALKDIVDRCVQLRNEMRGEIKHADIEGSAEDQLCDNYQRLHYAIYQVEPTGYGCKS